MDPVFQSSFLFSGALFCDSFEAGLENGLKQNLAAPKFGGVSAKGPQGLGFVPGGLHEVALFAFSLHFSPQKQQMG